MSLPEETLKTINTLVLNWQKTVVLTILTLLAVQVLFPIIIVVYLFAQMSGQLPSVSEVAHARIEANQKLREAASLQIVASLKATTQDVNETRNIMIGLSEDIVYLSRLNCVNTGPDKEARAACYKSRWMREYEAKKKEEKDP